MQPQERSIFPMTLKHKSSSVYHPQQPLLEKEIYHYPTRLITSPLFNGGIIFSMQYVDQSYMNQAIVVPDGCVHLVVCCYPEQPSANICGSLLKGTKGTFVRAGCEYFSICFLPGYAENFFKHPIGAFSGLEIPVEDVLPHANILLGSVAEAKGLEGRIAAFESFYIKYIRDTLNINALIKFSTEKIIHSNGTLHVTDLSQATGYSSRYIVKTFEKYVGLSPKLFSRIIRFQHVVKSLESGQYDQTIDNIYEYGYCDQNHFIKEFKEFSCHTPKHYMRLL